MPSIRPVLACGIVAPTLSIATDLLACVRWREYRPMTQSISELDLPQVPS